MRHLTPCELSSLSVFRFCKPFIYFYLCWIILFGKYFFSSAWWEYNRVYLFCSTHIYLLFSVLLIVFDKSVLHGILLSVSDVFCLAWACERCRICPSRFLAECHKRRLNQSSFVLLCFAFFFAFAGLYLVSVLSTGRAKKSYHLGKMLCLWNCSRYIYDICRDYRWGFGLHILQILLK